MSKVGPATGALKSAYRLLKVEINPHLRQSALDMPSFCGVRAYPTLWQAIEAAEQVAHPVEENAGACE